MSGIAGIIRLDGAPVAIADIESMLAPMQRRGPDRKRATCVGNAGFGQALLATTPEALAEPQPWVHPDSGCMVVSDSRLDNRPQLLEALGLDPRQVDRVGDGELLHAAYQRWGAGCADRLLGDFAFAIWDPRQQILLCGRDIMGVRPLYFHHAPGRLFVFASDTDALLALPEVPCRVNEGRIADALVQELEGIDRTSTFFLDIARLPPARTLLLAAGHVTQEEYWNPLRTPPDPMPTSEGEWTRVVREHLSSAVRLRLRGSCRVGSMVSGGLDSSSVAALGQEILTAEGRGRLATFSAINSAGECAETDAVRSMLDAFDFEATTIDLQALDAVLPAIRAQLAELREPFDGSMSLISAVYASAGARRVRCILDGMPADTLYTAGFHFQALARRGRLGQAWREARDLHRNDGVARPGLRAWQTLVGAFAPGWVRRRWEARGDRALFASELLLPSFIAPGLVHRVGLWERFQTYRADMANTRLTDAGGHAQSVMTAAYTTAAIERYNRVASFHGIEPRHPFLDRRVIELHAWLPVELRLREGRYKWVLREAMRDLLPADVAWRRGKEHLGYMFNRAVERTRPPEALDTGSCLPADAIGMHRYRASEAASRLAPEAFDAVASTRMVICWARRVACARPPTALAGTRTVAPSPAA